MSTTSATSHITRYNAMFTNAGTTYGVVLFNTETSASGTKVYNNTSGTDSKAVSLNGGPYTGMELANNIGDVDTQPGVTTSNNIPFSTVVHPLWGAQPFDRTRKSRSARPETLGNSPLSGTNLAHLSPSGYFLKHAA